MAKHMKPLWLAVGMLAFAMPSLASEAAHDTPEAVAERAGSGNPVAGKAASLSARCQSCHGPDGNSALGTYPKLAGQYADYLLTQVKLFQSGERKHPAIGKGLPAISEADLADIAAYFASQKPMSGGGQVGEPAIKALYARGDPRRDVLACASCHGEHGKSTFNGSESYPVIGGQHQAYVRAQLLSLRAGDRKSGGGGVMNLIAKSLKDEEIEALSNYIAGM